MLFLSCGANKHVYEICVFKKAQIGRVLSSQNAGISDTTLAFVSGFTMDKKQVLPGVSVKFKNKGTLESFTTISSLEGDYKLYLPGGIYDLEFHNAGYEKLFIEDLTLETGQRQKIIVNLGGSSGFVTYRIKSGKALSEQEYIKLHKKLSNQEE